MPEDAVDESQVDQTIHVLRSSERMGTSDRGFSTAVEYVVEGQEGKHLQWLDEFLEEHADGVQMGDADA